MRSIFGFAVVALATLAFLAVGIDPAFAQSETAAHIPVNAWIDSVSDVVTPIVVAVVGGAVIKVAGPIAGPLIGMFGQKRVNELLEKAIKYGFNSVKGMTPASGVVSIDLGNKVIASAVNYAIGHAPKLVEQAIGGRERLREKIIARLDLPADFDTSGVSPS